MPPIPEPDAGPRGWRLSDPAYGPEPVSRHGPPAAGTTGADRQVTTRIVRYTCAPVSDVAVSMDNTLGHARGSRGELHVERGISGGPRGR